jgi:hypothetical protein
MRPLTVMTSMVRAIQHSLINQRCRIGILFGAWSFQVTVKADLSQGASTKDKARLLKEHLSNCTAHSIKTSFTLVSTFCNESQLSGQPDSNCLVSILTRDAATSKQSKQHLLPRCRNFRYCLLQT